MRRRHLLLALAAVAPLPAWGAEAPRRRPRQTRRAPRASPPAAAAPRAAAAPPVDHVPTPSRIPGLEPAPVPSTAARPPRADSEARPSLSLGVPSPREYQQGLTFRDSDPSPEGVRREGSGLRVPAPGATLRLPF